MAVNGKASQVVSKEIIAVYGFHIRPVSRRLFYQTFYQIFNHLLNQLSDQLLRQPCRKGCTYFRQAYVSPANASIVAITNKLYYIIAKQMAQNMV